jgi:hypothetical protein
MSFTPTSAPTETVSVMETSDKALTVFKLHEIRTQYAPDGSIGRVKVSWSKGYMDGADYIPAANMKTDLEGSVLDGKLLGVEAVIWGMLNDEGLLPAGSVG